MNEPWKVIWCENKKCEGGEKILPSLDNKILTQFLCPKCGHIETWGITRRLIAKKLYERYADVKKT